MHGVVVTVNIEPGHGDEARAQLENNVVPRVRETPGVITGHWLSSPDGRQGLSVIIYENEETAKAAADMIPNAPRPDFVTFDKIEVREVVAHI